MMMMIAATGYHVMNFQYGRAATVHQLFSTRDMDLDCVCTMSEVEPGWCQSTMAVFVLEGFSALGKGFVVYSDIAAAPAIANNS